MSRPSRHTTSRQPRGPKAPAGASQRQLRAGELVRHALVEILREEDRADPALAGVSVTITEVKMAPDLRNALCFVEPRGGVHAAEGVKALNRSARFLRGKLGHVIDMKFTPELKFVHDDTFDEAARMDRLFEDPRVKADLEAPAEPDAAAKADNHPEADDHGA